MRGFNRWFLHSYAFPSRLPDPGRLAVPTRPVVVGAAPTLTRVSRLGLPPASAGCCDSPQARPFHPHQVKWRLVAHDRLPVDAGALHTTPLSPGLLAARLSAPGCTLRTTIDRDGLHGSSEATAGDEAVLRAQNSARFVFGQFTHEDR